MILNNAPLELATSSNNSLGEFRIKASAKSFQILSNSLYQHKIRAIVRELSTNAYDSHVSANKENEPFYVHFPTILEPYFAVQDFGTGLSLEAVRDVFTVFFESTKTESNDFVGVLGLGCKSPFAYTTNFTITSIQNGLKSVYTAFINDRSVPDITLLYQDDTTDSNGVTVQFAVHTQSDFYKFQNEASYVYSYFPVIPNTNIPDFKIEQREYLEKDIIPGVHILNYGHSTKAVMGMIPYPIDIHAELKEWETLLKCGLEIHFPIGALDFQPSREGLSYIPQTINAIKDKLLEVHNVLVDKIAERANSIDNLWERDYFLYEQKNYQIWRNAIGQYVKNTNFKLYMTGISFTFEEIQTKFNITPSGFYKNSYRGTNRTWEWSQHPQHQYAIHPNKDVRFVINDLNTGALARAKYHWKNTSKYDKHQIIILDVYDKSKPALYNEFFEYFSNPPQSQIIKASELSSKPKPTKTKTITNVVKLVSGYEDEWQSGLIDKHDTNITYYYVPLSGYTLVSNYGFTNAKHLFKKINQAGKHIPELQITQLYGIRKLEIDKIKSMPNWINYEEYIVEQLTKLATECIDSFAWHRLERPELNSNVSDQVSSDSLYNQLYEISLKYADSTKSNYNLNQLFEQFIPHLKINQQIQERSNEYSKLIDQFRNQYPLLQYLNCYTPESVIVQYVNQIDNHIQAA